MRLPPLFAHMTPWRGITFRSVDLAYASPAHMLSGEGSLKAGGRWNAPGAFPAIYSSTRPGTAVEEAFQLAADFYLEPDDLKSRVTCGIEWELSSVFDPTIASLPARLKLSDWMGENFTKINDGGFGTLCQAFGRAVRNSGIAGILCPSVRVKDGINLIVFRDRMRALSDIIKAKAIGPWLQRPNNAFDGSTPLQVMERGENDRLWRMIWQIREGNTG